VCASSIPPKPGLLQLGARTFVSARCPDSAPKRTRMSALRKVEDPHSLGRRQAHHEVTKTAQKSARGRMGISVICLGTKRVRAMPFSPCPPCFCGDFPLAARRVGRGSGNSSASCQGWVGRLASIPVVQGRLGPSAQRTRGFRLARFGDRGG
jgi:hypothetical protein